MQGRLTLTYIDRYGNAQRNRAVRVLNWVDGTPATLYTSPVSGIALPNNVLVTDVLGGAVAYCAGVFTVVDHASGQVVADRIEALPQNVLDPALPIFGAARANTNVTAAYQAALDAAAAGEGYVWTADMPVIVDTLVIATGVVWERAGRGRYRIVQSNSAVGPLLNFVPSLGAEISAPQSVVRNLFLDGNLVGVIRDEGTITNNNKAVTGLSNIGGVLPGYLIEGPGIPAFTTVASKAGSTVQMSAKATASSGGTTKIVFRPAYLRSAYAPVAGSYQLTVANADNLVPGLRVVGPNLELDGDDLSQSTVVLAVDGLTVTIDRPTVSAGTYDLIFFQKNPLIYAPPSNQAPNYNSTKEYPGPLLHGVFGEQSGGDALLISGGRHRTKVVACRLVDSYGGVRFVGSSDSAIADTGIGGHWEHSLSAVACATPHFRGLELWGTDRPTEYFALFGRNNKRLSFVDGELNGSAYLSGRNDDQGNSATFVGINAIFRDAARRPDGVPTAFVTADNVAVTWTSGCFAPDPAGDRGRPTYLALAGNGGTVDISGVAMRTDPGSVDTPFEVGFTDAASAPYVSVIYRDRDLGVLRFVGAQVDGGVAPIVQIGTHLVGGADQSAAFSAAVAEAVGRTASGLSRAYIDLQGREIASPVTLVVGADCKGVTLANGKLVALPNAVPTYWTEDDAALIAELAMHETVSAEGKAWSPRKPLLRIDAGNNGFRLWDVDGDGQGAAPSRLSAGIRVLGNTPDRLIRGGKWEACEAYVLCTASPLANDVQIDVDGLEMKPNGRTSRLDRTSYGWIIGGNDMFGRNFTISNCHATMLFTRNASTVHLAGYNVFNGGDFNPAPYQHKLFEYWGNSCLIGQGAARHGNGRCEIRNPDLTIGSVKWGYTAGAGVQTSVFVMYAKGADCELDNFSVVPGEIPFELKTSVKWMEFVAEGANTWKAGITTALGDLKGYLTFMAGVGTTVQGKAVPVLQHWKTYVAGAYHYLWDLTTADLTGFGVSGNSAQVVTGGVPRYEFKNNGSFAPVTGQTGQLGSPAQPWGSAYITVLEKGVAIAADEVPTLRNKDACIVMVSNTRAALKLKGTDGIVRQALLDLAP